MSSSSLASKGNDSASPSHVKIVNAKPKLQEQRCYDPPGGTLKPLRLVFTYALYGLLAVFPGLPVLLVVAVFIIPAQLLVKSFVSIDDSEVSAKVISPVDSTSPSPARVFTLLTYNIAGLSPQVNVNPPWRRLQELCTRLNEMEEQPDVICFQESFSSRVSNRIIGKTLTSYPYKVIEPIPIPPSLPLLGNTLQMNSGLCIVSKFPITSCTAKAYGTSCGADYQANKGVICATLDVGGGRTVKVVTTHMQSDPCNDPLWWCTSKPYESARDVKAEQLGVLSSVASKALEEGKKEKGFKGVLVCGDLNVPGEEVVETAGDADSASFELKPHEEYNSMVSLLPNGAVDCFRSTHALGAAAVPKSDAGFTIDGSRNLDNSEDELLRLDYVFSLGDGIECTKARVEEFPWTDLYEGGAEGDDKEGRRKCFSDHFAVWTEFKVNGE